MSDIYYLDHAATTKPLESVVRAMNEAMENFFYNPSASYVMASKASGRINKAKEKISEFINCKPSEIYFTSGATEADNMAIMGVVNMYRDKKIHIITSQIEHPAVLETIKNIKSDNVEISILPVDENGQVSLKDIEDAIKDNTVLISIMYANNETGIFQPIAKIGELCCKKGILFHTDAVQAFGHCDIDVARDNISLMSVTAHKMYGPKGIGFLYVNDSVKLAPLLYGGGQQKSVRPGTEDVALAEGFLKAVSFAGENMSSEAERERKLLSKISKKLSSHIEGIRFNSDFLNGHPGILNFSVSGIESEALLMMLDMKGIYVSAGSACASSKNEPSYVLKAMGRTPAEVKGAVRISVGIDNSLDSGDFIADSVIDAVNHLKGLSL